MAVQKRTYARYTQEGIALLGKMVRQQDQGACGGHGRSLAQPV